MELVIEPKDFKLILAMRFPAADAAQMAKALDVSKAFVYMLLDGTRTPSAAILEKVGFEIVYRDKRGRIVTPRGFQDYLTGRFPGTDEETAKHLGVGKQLTYLLRTGKRTPSAGVLKKCGLAVVYRMIPPEKEKR